MTTTDSPPASNALPWANGPYSIKRHGTTITQCDTEPVNTPGCIQAHGALLVVRLTDLTILQVSENSAQYLGETPKNLLGEPLIKVLGSVKLTRLRDMLKTESLESNALYAFTLPSKGGVAALDVCVHTLAGVAVLEFEALGRDAGAAQGDFFGLVKSAVGRLQNAVGTLAFCQHVADEVRGITRLDRVMVYRFHADNHGEVVAESKQGDLAPWLGMHYPEADIPKPARDIYKRIWVRPLPNAASALVEMVPLANPDTGQALNMTQCALRGASVMYTEYLANMGVAASLTMPILVDGELWGLIACHHQTPTAFPHQVRAACELLAQVASLQLRSTDHIERLDYRLKVEGMHHQLVARAAQEGNLQSLSAGQPSLLDAMQANGVALFHDGRWWCAGATPTPEQLDALVQWLDQRPEFNSISRPVYATDALAKDYAGGAALADVASGVIAVRVSRVRRHWIVWMRPETIQTINWAGNPHDKPLVPGPNGMRLTPRRSFELFVESVRERALPWTSVEIEGALQLRLLVMELFVSHSERLAEQNADLADSNEELDAFAYVASHDLKEPLRGIHRYAHQILENPQSLDADNRQRVESLMRLTQRMDSLLDSLMHFSRVGRTNLEFELADLNQVAEDALEMIGARRAENACTIVFPRPLPEVQCNPVRVREIFSNLVSNALKYTRQARPRIELGYIAADEAGGRPLATLAPLAPQEAQGHMIFYVRDDGIGIEPRHFDQVWRMFKRLHGRDEFGGGMGAGLTVVKKVVNRHGGVVWIDSTPSAGTTFYFTLPGTHETREIK